MKLSSNATASIGVAIRLLLAKASCMVLRHRRRNRPCLNKPDAKTDLIQCNSFQKNWSYPVARGPFFLDVVVVLRCLILRCRVSHSANAPPKVTLQRSSGDNTAPNDYAQDVCRFRTRGARRSQLHRVYKYCRDPSLPIVNPQHYSLSPRQYQALSHEHPLNKGDINHSSLCLTSSTLLCSPSLAALCNCFGCFLCTTTTFISIIFQIYCCRPTRNIFVTPLRSCLKQATGAGHEAHRNALQLCAALHGEQNRYYTAVPATPSRRIQTRDSKNQADRSRTYSQWECCWKLEHNGDHAHSEPGCKRR